MKEIKYNKNPTSFAQKRIWFLDTFDPDNSAYNIPYFWKVEAEVSIEVLEKSINYLIARHALLRTYFSSTSGEILQYTVDHYQAKIIEIETKNLDESIIKFAKRNFDLKKLPLFEAAVFHYGNQDKVIGFNFHHIICDGWSLNLFFRELGEVYRSYHEGKKPYFHDIPGSYIKYSVTEASSIDEKGAIEYWKKYLDGMSFLSLATDYIRPAVQSFEGQREIIFLNPTISNQLKICARETNSSLFMLLLSAYFLVMRQYSGQNDLVIGTPVANRGDIDFQDTFGLFVNSMVIRCNLSDNKIQSFDQLLEITKSHFLTSLEYQDYSFERVVEQIQPERALSHNPIFQVMFALQDEDPKNHLIINHTKAESIDPKVGHARFDLECTIWAKEQGIKIRLNYNTSLYNEKTAQAMLASFENILTQIAQRPLDTIDINDPILYSMPTDCLSIAKGADVELPDLTPMEIILNNSVNYPDNIAISCGADHITYKEFGERVGYIANYICEILKSHKSDRQKKAVLIMSQSIDMAMIIGALLRTNVTLIPINPDDPVQRKCNIIKSVEPDIIIASSGIDDSHNIINPQQLISEAFKKDTIYHLPTNTSLEDTAYIIHTSGTTGEPKGIKIAQKQLSNTLVGAGLFIKLNQQDVFVSWSSFSFDIFYLEFLLPLLSGATIRLVTTEELFNTDKMLEILSNATCIHAVPGLMHQLLDSVSLLGVKESNDAGNLRHLNGIRYAMTGGDLVPSTLLSKMQSILPKAEVMVLYGPTETTIICSHHLYSGNIDDRNVIGLPMANVEIRIVDIYGSILPQGAIGEIMVGGNGVSDGYLNQDALNNEKFVNINNKRFYKTGDQGKLAFDGNIEFHGRNDHQVKLRGFRININEISSVLCNHESIDNAFTMLCKQSDGAEFIASYVVTNLEKGIYDRTNFINNWQNLFDNTHKENKQSHDSDFSGWSSAIDGLPFSNAVMDSWLQATSDCILAEVGAKAQQKKLRILEIGCGTGLILFKLIEYYDYYIGTDLSSEVLHSLRNKIADRFENKIHLLQCAADQIKEHITEKFDVIIINSVCQYFPDGEYLEDVIRKAKTFMSDDDSIIFLGDIRAKHVSKYLYNEVAKHAIDTGIIKKHEKDSYIAAKDFFDSELLVAPPILTKIADDLSLSCFVTPKLDKYSSELSAYRYNAIFRNSNHSPYSEIKWYDWDSFTIFSQILSENANLANIIGFRKAPNARIAITTELSNTRNGEQNLELLDRQTITNQGFGDEESATNKYNIPDIKTLLAEAASKNFSAKTSWHKAYCKGEYDLLIYNDKITNSRFYYNLQECPEYSEKPLSEPIKKAYFRQLEKELIDYLSEILPRYMIPRQIEFIDHIPLGVNSKVNPSLLPAPRLLKIDSQYTAPANGLERDICTSWSNVLGVGQIGVNDNFFNLGGTSLLAIQAAIQLRKWGVSLRPQVIFKHQTIRELANFISKEQKTNLINASMVASTRDNPEFSKTYHTTDSKPLDLSCVLLFGATGFLGTHLLHRVLQDKSCDIVYCLVRGGKDAYERLQSTFFWYFPNASRELFEKVKVLTGDISAINMGLANEVINELQKNVTVIINAAANVSHVGDKEKFFKINVDGVHNIIDFARPSRKKIIHISTIGVKGLSHTPQTFSEMDLDIGQHMTEYYTESKLNAEIALNSYIREGGDALIFRVGTIAPNLKSGIFQKNISSHFFSRYIYAILNLKIAPKWDKRFLSLTPADIMADMIISIAAKNNAISTFHINNNNKISYHELSQWLQNFGYDLSILTPDDFNERIYSLANDQKSAPLLDGLVQLVDGAEIAHHNLSSNLTNQALDAQNIYYPNITPEWFYKFLNYGIKLDYFPNQKIL